MFDDLLLVVDVDDILHQFVNLIVIIGGQGNNFVPELMHVGELELEHEFYCLCEIIVVLY